MRMQALVECTPHNLILVISSTPQIVRTMVVKHLALYSSLGPILLLVPDHGRGQRRVTTFAWWTYTVYDSSGVSALVPQL